MQINSVQSYTQNTLAFQSGKLYLFTDFDHTLLPMNIDRFQSLSEQEKSDVREYFKGIKNFFKKCGSSLKFVVTTGRNVNEFQDVINYARENDIPLPLPDTLITENGKHKYKRVFIDKIFPSKVDDSYRETLFQQHRKRINTSDKKFDITKLIKKVLRKGDFIIVAGDGSNDMRMLNPLTYVEDYMTWYLMGIKSPSFDYANMSKQRIEELLKGEFTFETSLLKAFPLMSVSIYRDKYPDRFDSLMQYFGKDKLHYKMIRVKEGEFIQGIKEAIGMLSQYKPMFNSDIWERGIAHVPFKKIKLSRRIVKAATQI